MDINTVDNSAQSVPDRKAELKSSIEDLEYTEKDFLARKVQGEFALAKGARYIQETIWIRAHYNYKGMYDPETMANINPGASQAFVQATRPRVQTAVAMIMPILFPPGDKAWTLDPTPRPHMPELVAQLVGQGADEDTVKMIVKRTAELRAKDLDDKINDGLTETGCQIKTQRSVLDASLYGTSVIEGPYAVPLENDKEIQNKSFFETIKSWFSQAEEGQKYRPELDVVSPWDCYRDWETKLS